MIDSTTHPAEEQDRPQHALHAEKAIRAALAHKGIPARSQTNALADALRLTAKQIRRKLREGIWTLPELLRIQSVLQVSLVAALSEGGSDAAVDEPFSDASLLINDEEVPCVIRVGPVMTSFAGASLGCSKVKGKWVVSTNRGLETAAPGELRYSVDMLQVLDSGSPLRIAVLDDDARAAESLAAWFSEAGYPATAFTTTRDVEAAGLEHFDVYVLDVVLSDGTCYGLIGKIRDVDRDAVIILLTGKARGNAPLETELAEVVAEQRVDLAEKPTSPPLLLGRILSALARRPAI